ncbi:MAG TPA: FumA C-terminus/TtdB family hydratase beta subunit [Candidatus Cloacimonadota bacterium]|jgi:fumarate hydratase subunit beta|nr:FumA C-terminus/TtdB family hydratase beta subunit [Candidatus Cloacimonadales bacterium]HPY96409.1 FumA C-terminus/TtdB family hydratase beta subunit [Candidatus Cloacimonadota bacterium]HQB41018.1 FumA C-terminus/TtdB family hydratase beta subunit [Candidatus Cloacimonadota bacterium]
MKTYRINTPIKQEELQKLKAGDKVLLSGTIYTARDAAHKRMINALENHQTLPFDLENQIIYYCGPSPARDGLPIGAAGPTTSTRMDTYTPTLLANGVKMVIGKGERSQGVIDSLKKNEAIYLIAIGGAGAFYANKVVSSEIIAWSDLGAEAVYKLEVKDFLCFVSDQMN